MPHGATGCGVGGRVSRPRRTDSYLTAPRYLGLRVNGQVLGPIPPPLDLSWCSCSSPRVRERHCEACGGQVR